MAEGDFMVDDVVIFCDELFTESDIRYITRQIKQKMAKLNAKVGQPVECANDPTNISPEPSDEERNVVSCDDDTVVFCDGDFTEEDLTAIRRRVNRQIERRKSLRRKCREKPTENHTSNEYQLRSPSIPTSANQSTSRDTVHDRELVSCSPRNGLKSVLNGPTKGKRKREVETVDDVVDVSRLVALDCEMVGVGPGRLSALGRCSVVDYNLNVLLDIYSKPEERITDYRTPWSGIRERDMRRAVPFECAQRQIRRLLRDKVVVGHAVHNDFQVLKFHHPRHLVRDTAKNDALRYLCSLPKNGAVSLKTLARGILGLSIQNGHHCSIEDARATMKLYKRSLHATPRPGRKRARKAVRNPKPAPNDLHSFLDDHYWTEQGN